MRFDSNEFDLFKDERQLCANSVRIAPTLPLRAKLNVRARAIQSDLIQFAQLQRLKN